MATPFKKKIQICYKNAEYDVWAFVVYKNDEDKPCVFCGDCSSECCVPHATNAVEQICEIVRNDGAKLKNTSPRARSISRRLKEKIYMPHCCGPHLPPDKTCCERFVEKSKGLVLPGARRIILS